MSTFSGDHDEVNGLDPDPIIETTDRKQKRVQKLAEQFSLREVGNLDAVDSFIAQAEGIIRWDDLLAFTTRDGWVHVKGWSYRNKDGAVLYEAHRFNYALMPTTKKFILRRNAGGGWIVNTGPVRVPYNLPEIIATRGTGDLCIVEGEKGADACAAKGLRVTCVQGQNWTEDVASWFEGEDVVNLLFDADDAGGENTERALYWLVKVGVKTVRVPLLPGLGRKKGVDDWLETHSVEDLKTIIEKTKPEPSVSSPNVITATAYPFPKEKEIKPWDWLYGHDLLRGTSSLTVSAGGSGKSSKRIVDALSLTSGKPLLGIKPPRLLRVLLVNLEDDRNAMDKRIAAAMKHYRLTAGDIGGRLFLKAKGELFINVAEYDRGRSVRRNTKVIKALTRSVIENGIDVALFDPLISTHNVNENDNAAMRKVVEAFDTVAQNGNCAVGINHHNRKSNGGDLTVESARGGAAIVDAFRSVDVLETMSKEEGKRLEVNHRLHFRSFNGKLNFAPPVEESAWYRLVNVGLDNNDPMFGDNVGVVEAWKHPGKEEPPELTPSNIKEIMEKIGTEKKWREDIRAGMWVGKKIAEIFNLTSGEDKTRIAVKKLLKELLKIKALKLEEGLTDKRTSAMFVVAGTWAPVQPKLAPVHDDL
jgi:hypothetical protein